MPTLREFTDAHPIAPRLTIDWDSPPETLPAMVNAAIEALHASMGADGMSDEEMSALGQDLHLWHDDLRRVHLLSNDLASNQSLLGYQAYVCCLLLDQHSCFGIS
ncbi:MAG: hypothetical protein EBW14_16130 [Oxalobacteraceae bacterium]|nr:hypothetical protein [Oxalobacteraceae bacterium]